MAEKKQTRPESKTQLGRIETTVHWLVAVFMWTYPSYRLYSTISNNRHRLTRRSQPSPWISGLSVDKDDLEVDNMVLGHLPVFLALISLQLALGEILRRRGLHQLLPLLHLVVSSSYMLLSVGWKTYGFQIAMTALNYWATRTGIGHLAVVLPIVSYLKSAHLQDFLFGNPQNSRQHIDRWVGNVIYNWRVCHGLMYVIDNTKNKLAPQNAGIVNYMAYIFYAPVLKGPLLSPHVYFSSISPENHPKTTVITRTKTLLASMLRLGLIFIVHQVIRHIWHLKSLIHTDYITIQLTGLWDGCGFVMWCGISFNIKYMLIYGMGIQMARWEGVNTPLETHFVLWITKYSEMWRYFDNGMYLFIRDYIYNPIMHSTVVSFRIFRVGRRLLVSALIFAYIFIWHGSRLVTLRWTIINFIAVTIESTGRQLARSDAGVALRRRLGPEFCRRLEALFTAPLYIVSTAAQVGFLTDSNRLGGKAFEMLGDRSLLDLFVIVWLAYCVCQAAIDVRHWLFKDREIEKCAAEGNTKQD